MFSTNNNTGDRSRARLHFEKQNNRFRINYSNARIITVVLWKLLYFFAALMRIRERRLIYEIRGPIFADENLIKSFVTSSAQKRDSKSRYESQTRPWIWLEMQPR